MVLHFRDEYGCGRLAASHGCHWVCDHKWYKASLLHDLVHPHHGFYSCSDIACRSWLDKEICRMVFVGVLLLAEGIVDIIRVEECGNKVIRNRTRSFHALIFVSSGG